MTIRLYLDEDTSDADLMEALRMRSVDVVAAAPAGRGGLHDDDQLRCFSVSAFQLFSFLPQSAFQHFSFRLVEFLLSALI